MRTRRRLTRPGQKTRRKTKPVQAVQITVSAKASKAVFLVEYLAEFQKEYPVGYSAAFQTEYPAAYQLEFLAAYQLEFPTSSPRRLPA